MINPSHQSIELDIYDLVSKMNRREQQRLESVDIEDEYGIREL